MYDFPTQFVTTTVQHSPLVKSNKLDMTLKDLFSNAWRYTPSGGQVVW